MARIVVKGVGVWLLILACAFVNGAFRELVLLPNFAGPVAFVASGVLLALCIVAVSIEAPATAARPRLRVIGRVDRLEKHAAAFHD